MGDFAHFAHGRTGQESPTSMICVVLPGIGLSNLVDWHETRSSNIKQLESTFVARLLKAARSCLHRATGLYKMLRVLTRPCTCTKALVPVSSTRSCKKIWGQAKSTNGKQPLLAPQIPRTSGQRDEPKLNFENSEKALQLRSQHDHVLCSSWHVDFVWRVEWHRQWRAPNLGSVGGPKHLASSTCQRRFDSADCITDCLVRKAKEASGKRYASG